MTEALAPEFHVSVERLSATAVVHPAGELDIATVPALADVLRSLEQPCDRIALDLSGLTFIDSQGLALMVSEHRRAATDGFEFVVVLGNTPETILHVLRLTGLDLALPIAPDVASALPDDGQRPQL